MGKIPIITGIAACLAIMTASCETPKPTAPFAAGKATTVKPTPLPTPRNLRVTSIDTVKVGRITDVKISIAWLLSEPAEFVSHYAVSVWGGNYPHNKFDIRPGDYTALTTRYTLHHFRRPVGPWPMPYYISVRAINTDPKDRLNSTPSDTLVVNITNG